MNEEEANSREYRAADREEMEEKIVESPQKRRGRPEKKPEPFHEDGEELFTIHDNIFHAAVLFYTFRIFDKAPTRRKFNPTIGFSIYEKLKNFPPHLKKYYDNDSVALSESEAYKDNFHLQHFFINSLTFGPACVIKEFFSLFHFIIGKWNDGVEPDVELCLNYIKCSNIVFLNFDNEVLEFLEAKTLSIREKLKQAIFTELTTLLEIIIHTIGCLVRGDKENKFVYILDSEEEMFERGTHNRNKKKVKK